MDKKYQVFISSTFRDLEKERQIVSNTILDKGHIPAGMEQFGAIDKEQFEYIKQVIDLCDYFIIISAGKYGSLDENGVGYTEKEFDYARAKGIPIIALVHKDLKHLKGYQLEDDPQIKEKLDRFRKKIMKGRLCDMWLNSAELDGKTRKGLDNAIANFPRIGWVRADQAIDSGLLDEIRDLRRTIEQTKISEPGPVRPKAIIPVELSQDEIFDQIIEELLEVIEVQYTCESFLTPVNEKTTYISILQSMGRYILFKEREPLIARRLKKDLYGNVFYIDDESFTKIKEKLLLLDIIELNDGGMFWQFTETGHSFYKYINTKVGKSLIELM